MSSEFASIYIVCPHVPLLLLLTCPDVKSVVAIHGIGGLGRQCWETNGDPSVVWLRDAFGKDKYPRVIVLEYQTTYFTLQDIYEIARRLLSSLLELRHQIKVSLHNKPADSLVIANEQRVLEDHQTSHNICLS